MDGLANTASAVLSTVAYANSSSGSADVLSSSLVVVPITTTPFSATGFAEASLIGGYAYLSATAGAPSGTATSGIASVVYATSSSVTAASADSVASDPVFVSSVTFAGIDASAAASSSNATYAYGIVTSASSALGGSTSSIASATLSTSSSANDGTGSANANTAVYKIAVTRLVPGAVGDNVTALNYTSGTAQLTVDSPAGVEYTVPTQVGSGVSEARVLYTHQFFVTLDSTVSVLTGNRGYVMVNDIVPGDTLTTTVSRPANFAFRPLGASADFSVSIPDTVVDYRVEEVSTALNVGSVVVNGVVLGNSTQAADATRYNLVAMQADFLGHTVNDVLISDSGTPLGASHPLNMNSLPSNTLINGLPVVSYNEGTGFLNAAGAAIEVGSGGTGSSVLTTQGDLLTHDGTTIARLPAGTDGQELVVNPDAPTGLEWVTQSIERRAFYGDATPWPLGSVPANRVIKEISLVVLQPFNAPAATLSVGTLASPELLVAVSDSYPQQVGSYQVNPSLDFDVSTPLYLYISPDASTTGEVQIIITLQD